MHEGVERLGLGLQGGHGIGGEVFGLGGRGGGTQILEIVEEHGAQLIGIGADQRIIMIAVVTGEPAQLRAQVAGPVGGRGPDQQVVGQRAAQPEPQPFAQPRRFDIAQPHGGVVAGFVVAARDAWVGAQIPDVVLPPRGIGAAHRYPQVQMLDDMADVAPRSRRREPHVAALKGQDRLAEHGIGVQVGDAGRCPSGAGAVFGDRGRQGAGQPGQQGGFDLA
ncbi:Uncharacterised protein [Mycobacteroides abscessus subsp. abscessus]|nr:Uncharacterised protein [Mycobacteroides abscessus subsp. abscessus]